MALGAVSLTLFESSSSLVSLSPGESGTATASCASGETLSGGGYFSDSTSNSVIIVTRSEQGGFNAWNVAVFNYGSAGNFRASAEGLAVTPWPSCRNVFLLIERCLIKCTFKGTVPVGGGFPEFVLDVTYHLTIK